MVLERGQVCADHSPALTPRIGWHTDSGAVWLATWLSAAESLCLCWQGLLLRERRRLSHITEFILSVGPTLISHSIPCGGRVREGTEKGQGVMLTMTFHLEVKEGTGVSAPALSYRKLP